MSQLGRVLRPGDQPVDCHQPNAQQTQWRGRDYASGNRVQTSLINYVINIKYADVITYIFREVLIKILVVILSSIAM